MKLKTFLNEVAKEMSEQLKSKKVISNEAKTFLNEYKRKDFDIFSYQKANNITLAHIICKDELIEDKNIKLYFDIDFLDSISDKNEDETIFLSNQKGNAMKLLLNQKVTSERIIKRVLKEHKFLDIKQIDLCDLLEDKCKKYIIDSYIFSKDIDTIVAKINKNIEKANKNLKENEKITRINKFDLCYNPEKYSEYNTCDYEFNDINNILDYYEYETTNIDTLEKEFLNNRKLCEEIIRQIDEFVWLKYQHYEANCDDYDFYYAKFIQEQLGDANDFVEFLFNDYGYDEYLKNDYEYTRAKQQNWIETAISYEEDFKDDINTALDEIQKDKETYLNICLEYYELFIETLNRKLINLDEYVINFIKDDKNKALEYLCNYETKELLEQENLLKSFLTQDEFKELIEKTLKF